MARPKGSRNKNFNIQENKQKYIKNILLLKNKLGRTPSAKQFCKYFQCRQPCKHLFGGTWNELLLQATGQINMNTPTNRIEIECPQCKNKFMGKKSQLPISGISSKKNYFCSKSCSTRYMNQHKTLGYRRSKLQVWIQKKLIYMYPNLQFHFNKTSAINSELDIYIPKLKLAFQINGIFHYQPIYGQEKLKQITNNDHRKFSACHQKKISLCIIDVRNHHFSKQQKCIPYLDIITEKINYHITSKDFG